MREAMVGAFLAHLHPELEVDLSRIEPVLLKIADDVEAAWPELHLELEDLSLTWQGESHWGNLWLKRWRTYTMRTFT